MHRAVLLTGLMCLCVSANAQEANKAMIRKSATAKFATLPNIPDCMTVLVERGDPASGPSVVQVRMTPGCDSQWHWHTTDANVMVVSGAIQFGMKGEKPSTMQRGDFAFLPGHHVHQEKCGGAVPCAFFAYLYSPFDVHYVDSTGAEISQEVALKGLKKPTP
jgi:quercetin dioxygenase-like cupin family protein